MAAKIEMNCTSCGLTFQVPSEWAGKLAQCKCGNQVRIAEPGVAPAAPASSPSATAGRSSVGVLDASVSKFTYSRPDEDDETSISVKLEITNTATRDIEFLQSTTILFDGNQNPISVSSEENDVFIAAGDTEKVELYGGYINVSLAGGQPDLITAQIHLNGCSSDSADLGTFAISDEPFLVSGEQVSQAIGESATVQRVCAWSTRPDPDNDDDNSVEVQVHLLVENVSGDYIFKVQVDGQLLDNNGREIEEMENYEELRAGGTCVLESSFWGVNPKRLNGASIKVSASAFPCVASGQLSASEIPAIGEGDDY